MVTVLNPVSEAVGYDPTSPVIVVVPVLVIPEYARTAKGAAVPRFTVGMTAEAGMPPYAARIPTTRRKEAARGSHAFLSRTRSFLHHNQGPFLRAHPLAIIILQVKSPE